MNWSRGFKRVWYFILGLIWIAALAAAALDNAVKLGQTIAFMLMFSLAWLAFGAALSWVARGFKS